MVLVVPGNKPQNYSVDCRLKVTSQPIEESFKGILDGMRWGEGGGLRYHVHTPPPSHPKIFISFSLVLGLIVKYWH